MGMSGTGLKLRMELTTHKPGMFTLRQFHNLHQSAIGQLTGHYQTALFQLLTELIIEFVTMTMTFINQGLTISRCGESIRRNLAGIESQTHGAALIIHITANGVPSLSIGIATRYIHSHAGILHRDDYENTVKLIVEVIKKLDRKAVEKIIFG